MNTDWNILDTPQQPNGLKEMAYWAALLIANAACLGLMVMLLFR